MPIQGMNSINNSSSDEHEELLAEMELIERLPTQERLKQAKRRRALQLKKWLDYDREILLKESGRQAHKQSSSTSAIIEKKSFTSSNPMRSSAKFINAHSSHSLSTDKRSGNKHIRFQDHIVLLDAIMRKDYDEVVRLLEVVGVTPNSANEDGLTAIHQCCIDDSADLLRILIANGADVNVCDNDLWTPLHAAATCANLEICKILIENKAELLAVNTDGNMPYDICDDELCLEYIESEMAQRGVTQQAIDMKRSETEMRMLDDLKQICMTTNSFSSSISHSNHQSFLNSNNNSLQNFTTYFNDAITPDGRLNLNAKDKNGATLMHIACANGYTSILEFLLIDCQLSVESGAPMIGPSITVVDNDGWTPLHVATFWGHQKAIEILLEHGSNIDLKTNNDENVLDLCDDPDIRDFIIQKSREIENQQEQAAAMAAMQKQMQLINNINNLNTQNKKTHQNVSNSSSANGSIRRPYIDLQGSNNNNNSNNANNSTRSLKRTSTGVSRSSSVRRSSFREKEKAARKLDTSFKDVLYAQNSCDEKIDEQTKSNSGTGQHIKNTTVVKIINNKVTANESQSMTTAYGVIKNVYEKPSSKFNDENVQNNVEKNNIAAKDTDDITKKNSSSSSFGNKKAVLDDYNNNQLKLTKNTQPDNSFETNNKNSFSQNTMTDSSVARVLVTDGSAAIYSQNNLQQSPQIPTITLNNGSSGIFQSNMSSNFSMSSSLVSSTISNNHNASSSLSQTPNPQMIESLQSGNTISASSIAIIDMNHLPSTTGNHLDHPRIDYLGMAGSSNRAYKAQHTVQPTFSSDFLGVVDDGVKYKFISNETIGAKSAMNNEFCDLQSDVESNRLRRCLKCIKCCIVL